MKFKDAMLKIDLLYLNLLLEKLMVMVNEEMTVSLPWSRLSLLASCPVGINILLWTIGVELSRPLWYGAVGKD